MQNIIFYAEPLPKCTIIIAQHPYESPIDAVFGQRDIPVGLIYGITGTLMLPQ